MFYQVKASEIVPSSSYTANFTLRFPRVQKFRPNLMWSDCLNLDQLTELRKVKYTLVYFIRIFAQKACLF